MDILNETYKFIATANNASHEDISQGQLLGDQEGVVKKVLLKDREDLLDRDDSCINVLLDVCLAAEERQVPLCQIRDDFTVGERHPLQD